MPPRNLRRLLIGLVVLSALCVSSSALPWEDLLRSALPAQEHRTRGGPLPGCHINPSPVPQALINQRYMPTRLRNAINEIDRRFRAAVAGPASIGVVYDQQLIWSQGYGLIDPSNPSSPAVDANTIYRIGSISKVLTNLMLYKLADEGKIALDDPVSKYVPALSWNSPFHNNPGITWRSLAGQVSGLTGATPCNFFTIWEPVLGDACAISNEEAWKRVTAEDPFAPMWQLPHYSDAAYAVIGRALESVVGMSYEDYMAQYIFKPLGMDSTYITYSSWSDMAKRVPPGGVGNSSLPSFVSHADLNWARPTGNLYSTVSDLAKLASLFLVGTGETKNALGIYSNTLRTMLTPSFINSDQMTGYAFPFEVYHSTTFGADLPPYWIRQKVGSMPGYLSVISMVPELKTAFIIQGVQDMNLITSGYDAIDILVSAMEDTLFELKQLPPNPGNLTAFAGTYLANALFGYLTVNVTMVVDEANSSLIGYWSQGYGGYLVPASQGVAVWVGGNSFEILPGAGVPGTALACLSLEAGFSNVIIHFNTEQEGWFGGPQKVVSLEIPNDPYYGWQLRKQ